MKTIVYIDGFNLYYGLKSKKFYKYLWLDLYDLSRRITPKGTNLVAVKYFTTRQGTPREKYLRQKTFIEALESYTPIQVFYGQYTTKKDKIFWFFKHKRYVEKRTDVNIATHMISDAFRDEFDYFVLVSGDSDQVPTIEKIKEYCPNKKYIAAFPPRRYTNHLARLAYDKFEIGEKLLKRCLLPLEIRKKDGYILRKPSLWS